MTPAEVYQVEAYYLQYKWPLNKQQNWGIRISPPLTVPSRLAMPTNQELVQTRIDNYPCNSLHAQGLAQLGTSVAAAAEAETELYEGLDDQSDCESTFDSDWEQESSGDDGSEDEHSS